MQLVVSGEGGSGSIETVLPSGPELFFGALMFMVVVVAVIVALVVFLIRRLSSGHRDELEEWRERALRAEAQRDLLREQAADDSNEAAR